MYICYNYHTGEIVAQSDSISSLAAATGVNRLTISRHVGKNMLRDITPVTYAKTLVFIDGNTTPIVTAPPTPTPIAYHIYKANTGEYLAHIPLQSLNLTNIPNAHRSINNYALLTDNIYISTDYLGECITPLKPVYEIYTTDNTLQVSTFTPQDFTHITPLKSYTKNPYKPNHYIAKIPQKQYNTPVITYNENPLDNVNTIC